MKMLLICLVAVFIAIPLSSCTQPVAVDEVVIQGDDSSDDSSPYSKTSVKVNKSSSTGEESQSEDQAAQSKDPSTSSNATTSKVTPPPGSNPNQLITGFPAKISGKEKIIEDADESPILALDKIHFGGVWHPATQSETHGGSQRWCWTLGNFYEFKFSGRQFELYSNKCSYFGFFDVYIDEKKIGEVDQWGEGDTPNYKLIYRSKALSAGVHKVKVVNNNKTNDNFTGDTSNGACITIDYVVAIS